MRPYRRCACHATAVPRARLEYFYIWSLDLVGVMHPIKPEWKAENMRGKLKDGEGHDALQHIVDQLRASSNGKAFVPATFTRSGQHRLGAQTAVRRAH